MAPEIIERRPYQGIPVDIFALGVILFDCYAGFNPFDVASANDLRYNLLA